MNNGSLTAKCLGLVADKESRGCVEKARAANIPVSIVERKNDEPREQYDARLHEEITSLGDVDIIAALGWMWLLSEEFVKKWNQRIVNVHPSLLPKYPGAHGIQDALDAGDSESGMTIHCIDEGVDTGRILVQKSCSIEPSDTVDSLKQRVQELEKEWYPKVLQQIEEGETDLLS